MIKPAERMKNVKYAIRDIAVLAKQVEKEKKVLYLNIGDPNRFDFDTPDELKNAIINAMKGGHNYYADSQGIKEAVDAIVKHNNNLGIETDESNIILTVGVSEAVNIFVASLIDAGENVLIPSPSYPLYSAYINLYGCVPNFYTLDEGNEWDINVEDIEKRIDDKTKAVVIINPNNPTGGVYDKKALKELVNVAGQHNLIIFSDEIYDEMILEGEMHHIASFSEEVPVITCNGLAKNFLAPGWRTGWMAITDREQRLGTAKDAIMQMGRTRLCTTTPMQFAVKPALEGNRLHREATIKKLRSRRDLTHKRINEIEGLSLVKPKAAFYAFPRINFDIDDKDFVTRLLKEEGVATVHGSGFDMPNHFRIVYLPPEPILNEAFDKIENFVNRMRK
ncbi:MAG: aminotransferase class I/II-fold pyridoxal phosphate-dependent enzyme [Candidatus Aenigmarchaeota archaeon]|nr:aminotransferase class I/II-fold pyridoxal phosphate-dependent enzyme [Candidatus Aenigmarchaeota archaeon]